MRLARDEFANRSQNIVKFRKICYSFANCEFFLRNGAAYRPNGLLPPHTPPHTSHPSPFTPHLTPHFTSRLCDLRHNPLG